jgi:hypothetical protein
MKILNKLPQILLALAFLMAGFYKIMNSFAVLLEIESFSWVEDFSPAQVKLIGLAELFAGFALLISMLLSTAKMLAPLAALGLCVLMIGAAAEHLDRGESISTNVLLFILALVVFVKNRKDLKLKAS